MFRIATVELNTSGQSDVISQIKALEGKSIFSKEVKETPSRLLREYYVVESLSCRRGLPSSLRCDIFFRTPAMIWRANEGRQYLVDKQGVVYAEIKSVNGDDQRMLMTVVDNRGIPVGLGETIANEEVLLKYQESIDLFRKLGYQTGLLTIDETYYYFVLELTGTSEKTLEKPINLKLTTTYSLATQSVVVKTLVETKTDQVREYIDVRVPGLTYSK